MVYVRYEEQSRAVPKLGSHKRLSTGVSGGGSGASALSTGYQELYQGDTSDEGGAKGVRQGR